MKRIISLIVTAILFSNYISAITCNSYFESIGDTVYQAELAQFEEAALINDTTASAGSYLHIGKSGKIIWKVEAPQNGWYNLIFRYRALDGEKEEFIVRNDYQFAVGFRMSMSWNLFTTHTFLKQGMNSITLKKSWDNIDIDYLQISPVQINPKVVPAQNIFYTEYPRDVYLKLNRYGHKIKSVTMNEKEIPFSLSDYSFQEDAVNIRIPKEYLLTQSDGSYMIGIIFDDLTSIEAKLNVVKKGKAAPLTIIAPYVEHGKSVLLILPSGKTMLVDCGKDWVRDSLLIPFLNCNGISKLDYFIITHYHGDHESDDRGEKIKNLFTVKHFYDYKSFHTGDSLLIEGVKIKILNSAEDGMDENTNSLSFKLTYNGFAYVDGGDTYAYNQEKIMKRFPNDVAANLFSANHHFHGSVSTDYLRRMKPAVVFIQSQQAIYARSAYMEDFCRDVVDYMKSRYSYSIEALPNQEVGTVIFRINDKDDWTYETYFDYKDRILVPYLK